MVGRDDDARPRDINLTARAATIATMNDVFRKSGIGGRIVLTHGVTALGSIALLDILGQVRRYDGFSGNNDPYGERDFGAFSFQDERLFWKIDYYDKALTYGSEDPANAAVTTRVLTIMLASEY